jgi:aminodeoxyfutalosine synthase
MTTPTFIDSKLTRIWEKIQAQERLQLDDLRTMDASRDLLGIGWMANQVKEARFGKKAFYVLNQKLEPTNVCVLSCKFCDFATKRNQPNAYEMTVEEMVSRCSGEISEIHISGGMPPEWKFDNYLGIVRALRQAYPTVGIKAFTAVEVEWAARISKQSIEQVLLQFKEAGLTALPGGGAEVFSERVRSELFPFKIGAEGWLEVHRTAHQLGIRSNATLLYGHIETAEERFEHLRRLRNLEDEAPGFLSFIPLAFQPGTTGLAVQPPTVTDDLKLLAMSRLYLDNFPHIKAYWITLGEETASIGLNFGADDVDGTIGEERIMHAAGAASPSGLVRERLRQLIQEAGCVPVEWSGTLSITQFERRAGEQGSRRSRQVENLLSPFSRSPALYEHPCRLHSLLEHGSFSSRVRTFALGSARPPAGVSDPIAAAAWDRSGAGHG